MSGVMDCEVQKLCPRTEKQKMKTNRLDVMIAMRASPGFMCPGQFNPFAALALFGKSTAAYAYDRTASYRHNEGSQEPARYSQHRPLKPRSDKHQGHAHRPSLRSH